MSTIEKLLAQKQRLVEQLASDPGPNEREEIERLLTKMTACSSSTNPANSTTFLRIDHAGT